MPEISVVIPVYNVEQYLPKCIDSVLNQTWKDFELILVNDGSTDHSLSICRSYAEKDSRIHVIDKPNGGLSDARNAGMEQASGTYIDFIDSDDFVEPQLLEACREKFQETGADMVLFDYYQYHMATGEREVIANPFSEHTTYSLNEHPELITKIKNCAWGKMYRLSLFRDSHILYPWGCYYEDLGTTYRLLLRAKKIAFINSPLYDYLVDRPGNITSDFSWKAYHVLDMIKITMDDYKAHGVYEKYYEELKYLAGVNITECLRKTRTCRDTALVSKYIQVCFWFLKTSWPEYPKCRYPIAKNRSDWIYLNENRLRMYLKLNALRHKKEG